MQLRTWTFAILTPALLMSCGGVETPPEANPINVKVSALPTGTAFDSSITISLDSSRPAKIYYSMDGTHAGPETNEYTGPLELTEQTLINFVAITEDGVWSQQVSELYVKQTDNTPPVTAPRLLGLSDQTVFFNVPAGHTGPVERTVTVRSLGTDPVAINRVFISGAQDSAGFFDPTAFSVVAGGEPMTLDPGASNTIRIEYTNPSNTLQTALLVIDSDEQRTPQGVVTVELWGKKIDW